jgi:hypothetical protein
MSASTCGAAVCLDASGEAIRLPGALFASSRPTSGSMN